MNEIFDDFQNNNLAKINNKYKKVSETLTFLKHNNNNNIDTKWHYQFLIYNLVNFINLN